MRIHLTDKEDIKLTPVKQSDKLSLKPKGLWYSIDNAWIDWVSENMPSWLPKSSNKFEVIISPEARVLSVTHENLREFGEEHGRKLTDDSSELFHTFIDWKVLADKYDVIEFPNYSRRSILFDYRFYDFFYNALDCSSGCVLNEKVISLRSIV